MAILNNLLVKSSSRFIGTSYFQDVSISGTATLSSLSLSGNLSVTGNTTVTGTLGVTGAATFGNITATGTVVFSKTQDLSGTANSSPALIVGGTATSAHMELDANEIHAKATGTTVADLYLNNQGGKVYLSGNSVYASGSTFVATTGNIATLNSTNVNVTNNLRANHYDLQTVAQLGGSFYVSPTVKFPNSGTTLAVTKSGATLTLTITDSSITSTTMAGIVWSADSRVKVSGTINGVVTGTMDGTVSSINTGSHTLTLSVSGENSGSVVAGTYSASQFSDLSVMVYQRRDGSNDYRVGIWMNCYDLVNSSSTIRIYGGSSASPNVMLGNLTSAGLGTVNNLTPTGWGLFAQNAFLHGKVVANGGLIGNWTIGESSMYYSSDTPSNSSIVLAPGGKTASVNIGGSGTAQKSWVFTVKNLFGVDTSGALYSSSGKIGGWNIGTSSLYNTTNSMTSTGVGLYLGTDGIRNYASGTQYVNITSGKITALGVDVSGKITATSGAIGGFDITSTAIKTKDVAVTSNADNSISLSSADFTRTINSTSRAGLRFAIGDKFGVTGDGTIYAGSANISGTLTAGANSKIGPWNVTTTSIYKGANTLGSTTSGAAYFGDLGLSVGNKFKVDASGDGAIILGELAEGKTHIEVDSDSFDVCSGATTGDNAVKLATFGEITRIGSGGSNVFIDGSGFSFTNTDGDEMMKINVDNVVIGKEGSSYFYVDSNSIILKDNENADVFKVESGGGSTESTTFNDDHYDKFSGTQISQGYTKTHSDNGAKSSVNKIIVKFYKTYTETIVINGQNVTREFLKFNNAIKLDAKYYTTSFVENSNVKVTLTSGSSGGVQYINNLLLIYCDSQHPRFDIVWTYSHKTETYSNLNMDGNMNVTGVISAENKIQSDEIFANNITADDFTFWANGMSINEMQQASAAPTITSSNKIDSTPAIGAQLTLYSGVYLLVANGNFNSGSSSGQRINQIAIYTGLNPTNANIITSSRVRVVNAGSYWSSLSTQIIVTVPSNTGQTFTVGLTSSIAQSAASSTLLQAVYLRPPSS